MLTNLDFQISADSTKARADIELLKGSLQQAQKEVRALRTEGAKSGDVLPSAALQTSVARVQALEKQLASLNRTTKETSSVMDVLATKSMRRLLTQFDNVGKSAQNIAMVMGGVTGSFAGGFLAASVFKGISTLIGQLDAVNERLLKLRDTAQQTGQRPAAIEAAQRIARLQGRSAEDADKIMTGTAKAFADLKTEAGKPISTTGVKDLTDRTAAAGDAAKEATTEFQRGVLTQRGAAQLTLDLAQAYKTIGINIKDYKDDAAGLAKFQRDVNLRFVEFTQKSKLGQSALNELSKKLFDGLPADAAIKLAPDLIANLNAEMAKLAQTQARIDAAQSVEAGRARVQIIFEDLFNRLNDWGNRVSAGFNKWEADVLEKSLPDFVARFTQGITDMWTKLPFGQDWMDRTKAAFNQMWEDMKATATAAADAIAGAFNAVKQTLSTSFPGDPGGMPAAIPGNAAGGMIRGPGSGTSDSILARLSNGEFVMRAAAVSKWGPRFMAALNSLQNPFGYAGGGLVRAQRFAAGGMVTARTADGVTVNLSFPGGTFALRGDAAIVGGLTREARRAGMLSAGRLAAAIN